MASYPHNSDPKTKPVNNMDSKEHGQRFVLAVSGCTGSGKTSLAFILERILAPVLGDEIRTSVRHIQQDKYFKPYAECPQIKWRQIMEPLLAMSDLESFINFKRKGIKIEGSAHEISYYFHDVAIIGGLHKLEGPAGTILKKVYSKEPFLVPSKIWSPGCGNPALNEQRDEINIDPILLKGWSKWNLLFPDDQHDETSDRIPICQTMTQGERIELEYRKHWTSRETGPCINPRLLEAKRLHTASDWELIERIVNTNGLLAIDWKIFSSDIANFRHAYATLHGGTPTNTQKRDAEGLHLSKQHDAIVQAFCRTELPRYRKTIQKRLERIAAQNMAVGFEGHYVKNNTMHLGIVEGLYLFCENAHGLPLENAMKVFDMKILLQRSYQQSKEDHFTRGDYRDYPQGTRMPHEAWKHEAYFDLLLWPQYRQFHSWIFKSGHVDEEILEKRPDEIYSEKVFERGVVVYPKSLPFGAIVNRAISEILYAIEQKEARFRAKFIESHPRRGDFEKFVEEKLAQSEGEPVSSERREKCDDNEFQAPDKPTEKKKKAESEEDWLNSIFNFSGCSEY